METQLSPANLAPFPGYTAEQSRLAREWNRLSEAGEDDGANAIMDQLEADLSEKLTDRLLELAEKEREAPTTKVDNSAPKPKTAIKTAPIDRGVPERDPDWIDFPAMNHEKYADLKGYQVDKDDRLKEPTKGKGYRGRILSPARYWQGRDDGSAYFVWGYKIRGGVRGRKGRPVVPRWFIAQARLKAEQLRRKDYWPGK